MNENPLPQRASIRSQQFVFQLGFAAYGAWMSAKNNLVTLAIASLLVSWLRCSGVLATLAYILGVQMLIGFAVCFYRARRFRRRYLSGQLDSPQAVIATDWRGYIDLV
jgi:ABC-type uncharacterized transport system permease subunit